MANPIQLGMQALSVREENNESSSDGVKGLKSLCMLDMVGGYSADYLSTINLLCALKIISITETKCSFIRSRHDLDLPYLIQCGIQAPNLIVKSPNMEWCVNCKSAFNSQTGKECYQILEGLANSRGDVITAQQVELLSSFAHLLKAGRVFPEKNDGNELLEKVISMLNAVSSKFSVDINNLCAAMEDHMSSGLSDSEYKNRITEASRVILSNIDSIKDKILPSFSYANLHFLEDVMTEMTDMISEETEGSEYSNYLKSLLKDSRSYLDYRLSEIKKAKREMGKMS